MFNSILTTTTGALSVSSALICMGLAVVLGVVISVVHAITSRSNKNFAITLAVLPAIVQVVIMLVNGNLGTSVAVAGAFALVRFRSMPGNSKEIVSVFFSMAIGLALGMGYAVFAVYATLAISLILLILSKTKFGCTRDQEKRLKVTIPEDVDYNEELSGILKNYTSRYNVERIRTINLGSMYEITYNIVLKDKVNEKNMLDELRVKNGNLNISLNIIEEGVTEL